MADGVCLFSTKLKRSVQSTLIRTFYASEMQLNFGSDGLCVDLFTKQDCCMVMSGINVQLLFFCLK